MTMEFSNPPDAELRAILERPSTVAVVGCSDNPARDSLRIAKLLKSRGFKVIPVNPQLDADALRSALGEKCYPDLASIPEPIEMVDVFRRSEFVPEIVEDADRQRCARAVVSARRNQPRRGPPRAASRDDGGDGSMPGDRIRAIVLSACGGG